MRTKRINITRVIHVLVVVVLLIFVHEGGYRAGRHSLMCHDDEARWEGECISFDKLVARRQLRDMTCIAVMPGKDGRVYTEETSWDGHGHEMFRRGVDMDAPVSALWDF